MRRLLLLRHAKSDQSQPGKRDHDRVLNPRGRAASSLIGAFLTRHKLVPDLAVVSTAARARETWELAASGLSTPVSLEARLYDAAPNDILTVIHEAAPALSTIIIVGHNPGFHAIALHLVGAGDIEARQRLQEKYSTAGLAVIDFTVDDWKKVRPNTGRLSHFVTPAMLATATD